MSKISGYNSLLANAGDRIIVGKDGNKMGISQREHILNLFTTNEGDIRLNPDSGTCDLWRGINTTTSSLVEPILRFRCDDFSTIYGGYLKGQNSDDNRLSIGIITNSTNTEIVKIQDPGRIGIGTFIANYSLSELLEINGNTIINNTKKLQTLDGLNSINFNNGTIGLVYNGKHDLSNATLSFPTGILDIIVPDDSISTAKIAASAITSNELATSAVIGSKIANGTITMDKLEANLDFQGKTVSNFVLPKITTDLELEYNNARIKIRDTRTTALSNCSIELLRGLGDFGSNAPIDWKIKNEQDFVISAGSNASGIFNSEALRIDYLDGTVNCDNVKITNKLETNIINTTQFNVTPVMYSDSNLIYHQDPSQNVYYQMVLYRRSLIIIPEFLSLWGYYQLEFYVSETPQYHIYTFLNLRHTDINLRLEFGNYGITINQTQVRSRNTNNAFITNNNHYLIYSYQSGLARKFMFYTELYDSDTKRRAVIKEVD